MTIFEAHQKSLCNEPRVWLVTGAAGFIGSNLIQFLLELDQSVVAMDNFSTGKPENLEDVQQQITASQWARLKFLEADIRDAQSCRMACDGVDYILHQAALGSVPQSIEDPISSHESNVKGMLQILQAAHNAGVKRLVYASSCAVYGDHLGLPKRESEIGNCLSPYAVTKLADELYADVFARCYGLSSVGLRYFNVFGRRQDPNGPYAAVIPKWISAMLNGEPVRIFGDGETSRDFCYIQNVVQANIAAALTDLEEGSHEVFNVAVNVRTTLNELFDALRSRLAVSEPRLKDIAPEYRDFRAGDVRHSEADISHARERLGYVPTHTIDDGLSEALDWYLADYHRRTNGDKTVVD